MATFKRKIFYLSGFDPRGASFYHRMMAEQAAADAARGGPGIAVGRRRTLDAARAEWTIEAPGTATSYTCLRWEDLVRAAWIRDPRRLVARGFATYWRYLTLSDWPRVLALPRAPLTTLYYPLAAMVAVPLLLALAAGLLLGLVLPGWAAALLGLAIGAAGSVPVLVRLRALWLVRLYVFNDLLARGRPVPGLDARLDLFADAIAAELAAGDADEVLLVTHSNGSILAFPLVERLLARTGGTLPGHFAVVTLAQCIPLVALRRDAAAYRASIATVAAVPFRWIDISFPPDGACYAGVDPFALGRPPRVATDLTMLSPRFFRFRDAEVYEARRKQKYELHFEYLRTGQRPSPIDILGITTAPHPIAQSIDAFRLIA
ncbi:MAG: hypothetical protein PGN09_11740 [Sphingomonas fennica]